MKETSLALVMEIVVFERTKAQKDSTAHGVIKYLYQSKDLTIPQLAICTGLSEGQIGKIVNGKSHLRKVRERYKKK